MLTITCTFDPEFAEMPGVGMDPLGEIVISGGDSEIRINNTYLDSWLTVLIDGLHQLNTKSHVRVETAEEPEPLYVDLCPDRSLGISYKDKQVVAQGRAELERALRVAAHRFLTEIRDAPDAARNRLIDPIRTFCLTTKN
jgi:hypothetical protein